MQPTSPAAAATTPEDMLLSRAQTGRLLSAAQHLPISFTYDGRRVDGIPAEWQPTTTRRRIDANIVETVFEGADDATGLHVRVVCQAYADYPVVEWTAWLTNRGQAPTPLIEDLLAMDAPLRGASPVVQHCNGDFYSEEGYTPRETPLGVGETLACAPRDGRPCDGAFPYFRVQFEGVGASIAVGWPAQWSAAFRGLSNGVHITAGQEQTHLRLLPGECIRTPRMTVLSWAGDTSRGINLWRRWYLDHVLPRPDGRPLGPTLACSCNDGGEEFTQATEENQLRFMDAFRSRGFAFDVWWIDAGWYPCADERGERHWVNTGTWEPDPARFPHGLKPIADRAAQGGADLLLWFEPERVIAQSRLDTEHPDWLLPYPSADPKEWLARNKLLDLGNPECRRWLTAHVSELIRENGIGVYRQDFNFPPLRYWRDNEADDRRGIRENLHVQGYLQYWDDLLAAHPGLWIDSCASGGRRNDLETMRRSVPLHYSDYGYGIHPVKLAFHHTLYAWIPYFKEVALSWDTIQPGDDRWFNLAHDSFAYHCGMAPMMATAFDIRSDDTDHDPLSRQMIAIWRRAAEMLLHGDYYPQTPFSRAADRWVVWQFDRPELGDGFLQGIRHRDCAEASITVRPQALRPEATYLLENPETGEILEAAGASLLRDGFTFTLPQRGAAIWFYRVNPQAAQAC